MKNSIVIVLAIALIAGCATSENAVRERQLVKLKVNASQGDPHASRDLALAMAMNGEKVGTATQALAYAKAAQESNVAGSSLLYARLLEATLNTQQAYSRYLKIASNPNKDLIEHAQSLIRLQPLLDLVQIKESDVETLLELGEQEGLRGELAALAAEQAAIRLGSNTYLRQARASLGIIEKYRRSSRINSFAALPIPLPTESLSEHIHNRELSEPIVSVDGN